MSEGTYEADLTEAVATFNRGGRVEIGSGNVHVHPHALEKFLDHVASFGRPKSVILGCQIVHDAQAGIGTSPLHKLALREIEKEGLQGYEGPLFVVLDEVETFHERKLAQLSALSKTYGTLKTLEITNIGEGRLTTSATFDKRAGVPVTEEQEVVVPLHVLCPTENNF